VASFPESARARRDIPSSGQARERILATAYDLFSRHGIRAIGVDTIVATSGVAKTTFYRHFPSKDDLVLAFLERREERWTRDWLQEEVQRRASTPAERLLVIFDVFDEWFRTRGFEGCSFINVLLEIEDATHPVHTAAVEHLATIRAFLHGLAEQVGVRDPGEFSRQWHMLMKGSIVAAGEGDTDAARTVKKVAALLLADELGDGKARSVALGPAAERRRPSGRRRRGPA
jgi:AcrR family transcriptional regulator